MTLKEFAERHWIKITSTRVKVNPNMPGNDMDHWRVTLRYMPGLGGGITIPFSQGFGHHGAAPELTDVLRRIQSDASGLEGSRDFEDWAGEYGYDVDSRTAERTYRTVKRQTARLRSWLGGQYQTFLECDPE